MEIKATTRYDYTTIRAFTHLLMFHSAEPKKRMILWSIIYAILFLAVIVCIIVFKTYIVLYVLAGVLLFCFLLLCYCYFLMPKIKYRSLAKMKDTLSEFVFCEDIIKVSSVGTQYNGKTEMKYSMLFKVMETSRYFFIYQNKSQVFIVDKSTVVGGTITEIRNILCSNVGDKYVHCKY